MQKRERREWTRKRCSGKFSVRFRLRCRIEDKRPRAVRGKEIQQMRGKIVYAGILAVTVYLNMLYHWELGNFVLAFEGMFSASFALQCRNLVDWFVGRVEAYGSCLWRRGSTTKSDICQNRLCIPVCKMRIDLKLSVCGR